ncbi:MAG TPA: hypothetical protein VK841_11335, partial [Polyangiaceae bacterium]|nr:hypothetical protein [Polyangiaceae bacterium]
MQKAGQTAPKGRAPRVFRSDSGSIRGARAFAISSDEPVPAPSHAKESFMTHRKWISPLVGLVGAATLALGLG